jgi:probable F420-dependent oxidoreductase
VKFAVTFGRMHPRIWTEAAEAADRLGFESIWLPEHLVLPMAMAGSPYAGAEHPPVPPTTQLFDAPSLLSYVAARTSSVRLGTYVYLLGLRHPFITARAFATLDWLSGGRAVIGAGAGWLRSEWEALGLDPSTRGGRLDEAIEVCRRLWTEETIAHDGPYFPFDEVAFEPKPVQQPIPILIGGESALALRRAGRLGDGWIGRGATPETAATAVATIRAHRAEAGREAARFEVTVGGACADEDDAQAWEAAGVDRLIVSPWQRTAEVLDAMESFAARFIAPGGAS